MGMSPDRVARNDEIFREANERILERAREYQVDHAIPFLCECAQPSCAAIVRLDRPEYERIRRRGGFFNAPGHAEPFLHVLVIVERHPGYEVVARNTIPVEVDERARKIGLNEAVFRQVNERIQDVAQTFGLGDRTLDLVCECGDGSCTLQIRMTTEEYEAMRGDPTLFAVSPGHEMPDVEDVVEKHDGYDVVRKHAGDPAEIAKSTDPRG
jgi:hypothetical protein